MLVAAVDFVVSWCLDAVIVWFLCGEFWLIRFVVGLVWCLLVVRVEFLVVVLLWALVVLCWCRGEWFGLGTCWLLILAFWVLLCGLVGYW